MLENAARIWYDGYVEVAEHSVLRSLCVGTSKLTQDLIRYVRTRHLIWEGLGLG